MNPLERDFLATSQALAEREAAERELQRQGLLESAQRLADVERQRAEDQAMTAGKLRRRALILGLALILAIGMAFTALFFGFQARRAVLAAQEQQRISSSRELAAAAIGNLEKDPQLSLLLALQAAGITSGDQPFLLPDVEYALRNSIMASRLVRILPHGGSLAVSPDGETLATGGQDGQIILWKALVGEQLLGWGGHTGRVADLAYSPDGQWLASAGLDGQVNLWEANSGRLQHTWILPKGGAYSVAFSPDGGQLAAGGEGTAWVWDVQSFEQINQLTGHNLAVSGIGYSPDGELISTIDSSGMPRLWEAKSGGLLDIDSGLQSSYLLRSGTGFSPSGSR